MDFGFVSSARFNSEPSFVLGFFLHNATLFPRVLFCVLYTGAIFCPVLNLNSSARYNAPHTAQKGCEIETSATLETLEEWGVLFQGFFSFVLPPPDGVF